MAWPGSNLLPLCVTWPDPSLLARAGEALSHMGEESYGFLHKQLKTQSPE